MSALTLDQMLARINGLEQSLESVRISATELRQWKEVVQQAMAQAPSPPFLPYSDDNIPQPGHIVRVISAGGGDSADVGAVGRVMERDAAPWIKFDLPTKFSCSVPHLNISAGYAGCMSMHKLQRIA